MLFIAILDVSGSNKGSRTIKFMQTTDLKQGYVNCFSEEDFLRELNKLCSTQGAVFSFVNFKVSNSKLEESAGSFSRFEDKNGVSPRVILAEYVSEAGRVLGYVVADKSGRIVRARKEEILSACGKAKQAGVPFIQNAIYRVTDNTAMLAAYPGNEFYKLVQQLKKKMPEPKVAEHIKKSKSDKNAETSVSTETKKEVKPQASKPEEKPKNSDRYTEAQKKELIAAKKNGVDPLIVSNPKLTPEQMRIIWTAKRNNMASEYFANPKFSVEQMQFFAERLVDKRIFSDCRGFISPKYNVEQLAELYLGVCAGIDYTQYADPSLSAEDMYVKRTELTCKTYSGLLVGSGVDERASKSFLRRLGKGSDKSSADNKK